MTLTIGLIGCGRWGTIHHATLMSLKQEGYLDRLVVCDIDATARDAVEADAHYASIDAMLTSEQLDGVAIGRLQKHTLLWRARRLPSTSPSSLRNRWVRRARRRRPSFRISRKMSP